MIDRNLNIKFRIDLSIFDMESSSCPTADDIEQVATYAEAKGCKEAVLIYPECSLPRLEGKVGEIRIGSATFSLAEDLESAGRKFVKESLGIEID